MADPVNNVTIALGIIAIAGPIVSSWLTLRWQSDRTSSSSQDNFRDDLLAQNKAQAAQIAEMAVTINDLTRRVAELESKLIVSEGAVATRDTRFEETCKQHANEIVLLTERHSKEIEDVKAKCAEERQRRRVAQQTADLLVQELVNVEKIADAADRTRYVTRVMRHAARSLDMSTPMPSLASRIEQISEAREDESEAEIIDIKGE
jgi:hypothetical protein